MTAKCRRCASGMLKPMIERLLNALRVRRPLIHQGWATRLRAVPCSSALAHPDSLVHLMNRTLDQIFKEIAAPSARRRPPPHPQGLCRCGCNPLLDYFSTAALTFQHTVALCADEFPITAQEVDQVERAVTRVACREISTFCTLCLKKDAPTPRLRECARDMPSEPLRRPCEKPG